MPRFSRKSLNKLSECNESIQKIMNELIKEIDVTIICGHRSEEEQNASFNMGRSQVQYPNSKHNKIPSEAIDIVPYPIDWNDLNRFKIVADKVKEIAKRLNINIRWGGDFKSFYDGPHFEEVIDD